jgi:hypothetical protein
MSEPRVRAPDAAPASYGDDFTSEETQFFATGDAMDAVVDEDAAAESWDGEVLASSPRRRWSHVPLGARLALVLAVTGGLFVLGSWLVSRTQGGPVARASAAKSE